MTELDVRSGVPERYRAALELLALATCTAAWHSFELGAWPGQYLWKRCGDVEGYVGAAHRWGECELRVSAVPLVDRGSFRLRGESGVLWACTETGASWERLRRFSPEPTLTLQYGNAARYVAFWALSKPLGPEDTERANKRLAHALFCPKKHASPGFWFYPPGAVIRAGRKRPVVCDVAGLNDDGLYSAGRVVKRLKDAPDPMAWRTKAA